MMVSYKWLQELVPIPWGPGELAERLTAAGVAVEQVWENQVPIRGVVAGEIRRMEMLAGSDGLRVARVDVGPQRPEPLTVITGAANVAAGDRVPVALPGACLPGGTDVSVVEIRGARSEGMMCSAEELGLDPSPGDEGGIMVLPADVEPGDDVGSALAGEDAVLELDLTPNRGDCLSMMGVARDVAALGGGELRAPSLGAEVALGGQGGGMAVDIQEPHLCPRYSLLLWEDVHVGVSPLWMQQRLRAAGMRPINNVVDVTNYVMLETGQPLHAFDVTRIAGGQVVVRRAREGEALLMLDDQERVLGPEDLVIADPEKVLAVAGVMGGAGSEVEPQTRAVALEAAHFHARNLRRTAQRLGLRTEASTRFEKGVDPNGTVAAARRASFLLARMGAARLLPQAVDVYPLPPQPRRLLLRRDRVEGLLGLPMETHEIAGILDSLQFRVQGEDPMQVEVPTFRPDVEGEADLVEEVARIKGYDAVPETLLRGELIPPRPSRARNLENRTRRLLASWGLREIVTYSFYNPGVLDSLGLEEGDARRCSIPLHNPLTRDQGAMRTTLVPGMLQAVALNTSRNNLDLALYEMGRTYHGRLPLTELPQETERLGIILAGKQRPPHWREEQPEADFFRLKGVLEALLGELGLTGLDFYPAQEPFLHPGRQACVRAGDRPLGVLGEVHPSLRESMDVPVAMALAELDFAAVLDAAAAADTEATHRSLPRFPAVHRDLALLVPEEVPARRVEEVIERQGGDMLEHVQLFDLYAGAQIPDGMKNLAFTLAFRSPDRTLQDAEVRLLLAGIQESLESELGARLRY